MSLICRFERKNSNINNHIHQFTKRRMYRRSFNGHDSLCSHQWQWINSTLREEERVPITIHVGR